MFFFFLLLMLPLVVVKGSGVRGYNFGSGLETEGRNFACHWQHEPLYYVHTLSQLGFTDIRLPLSLQYIQEGNFKVLDDFMWSADGCHRNVTFDLHRVWNTHQSYEMDAEVPLSQFIAGWLKLLERYHTSPVLTRLDIFNEYQGTDAGSHVQKLKAVIRAIEEKYPGRFVYLAGGTNWGGNIHDISLEDEPYADRVMYTIHRYVFSGTDAEQVWDYSFGNMPPHKINVGEWGFRSGEPDQVEWAKRFIAYLKKKGIRDNYFWEVALSSDTQALWKDDCQTFDWAKFNIVKTLWEDDDNRRMLR